MDRTNWSIRALLYSQFDCIASFVSRSIRFWEVHTDLEGPRINQSNRKFLSCYTIKVNVNGFLSNQINPKAEIPQGSAPESITLSD